MLCLKVVSGAPHNLIRGLRLKDGGELLPNVTCGDGILCALGVVELQWEIARRRRRTTDNWNLVDRNDCLFLAELDVERRIGVFNDRSDFATTKLNTALTWTFFFGGILVLT